MCATQLNPLVHSGIIAQYCVLNVSEFIVNTLGSGVKICILLGCETAGPNPGDKIGTPVDISKIPGGPPPVETNNNFGNNSGAQPMYGGMQGQQQQGGGGRVLPTNAYINNACDEAVDEMDMEKYMDVDVMSDCERSSDLLADTNDDVDKILLSPRSASPSSTTELIHDGTTTTNKTIDSSDIPTTCKVINNNSA
jgi:hypothetical protein